MTEADASPEAQARLIGRWRREQQQPFRGWDFAYLEGRMLMEQPPWSYAQRAAELLRGASSVVDLGTGGGERILELREAWPARVTATEEHPPNFELPTERLVPLGVRVASAAWKSTQESALGDGDVWRLRDGGRWLDLMYWTTAWGDAQLRQVLVDHKASPGYSTASWRSIRDAQALYARDVWHTELQQLARQPYPEELRRNIVRLNYPFLRAHPFSYRHQTAKAIERHDTASINHRVAAWLASYFDILFAVNRVLHPGEKRLLDFATRECPVVPEDLSQGLERLLRRATQATSPLLDAMDELTDGLEVLVRREHVLID